MHAADVERYVTAHIRRYKSGTATNLLLAFQIVESPAWRLDCYVLRVVSADGRAECSAARSVLITGAKARTVSHPVSFRCRARDWFIVGSNQPTQLYGIILFDCPATAQTSDLWLLWEFTIDPYPVEMYVPPIVLLLNVLYMYIAEWLLRSYTVEGNCVPTGAVPSHL
jgi:hypothetical protein